MHKFIEVEFERADFGGDLGNNLLEFFVVFVGWSVDYVCKLLLARSEMRLIVIEVFADVKTSQLLLKILRNQWDSLPDSSKEFSVTITQ